MQRSIIPAFMVVFAASTVASAPALARQLTPTTPPMVVVAQPPQVQSGLGGGLVEFLFRGSEQQPKYVPRPQYIAPPQAASSDPSQSARPRYAYANPAADPAVEQPQPSDVMDPRFLRREVAYDTTEKPGTIVIDTPNHYLYLVEGDGRAMRYGIGVGRPGFTWAGVHKITGKKEWPDWVPPEEMLERQPYLPHFMAGGPNNPLGARALYIGSTLYRIHGSNQPWTIGHNVSSGCIRLRNADVIDLYSRVNVGSKVVVL
jgi:lipoprotein-anchoring transpeptidase ErfK/SrfK